MSRNCTCYICGFKEAKEEVYGDTTVFPYPRRNVYCPICGNYNISTSLNELQDFDKNKLIHYMVYNGVHEEYSDKHLTFLDDKTFTMVQQKQIEYIYSPFPIQVSKSLVDNWYPKTFAEKIDFILQYFYRKNNMMGEKISLTCLEEESAVLFANLFSEKDEKYYDEVLNQQNKYMQNYLSSSQYISSEETHSGWKSQYTILPIGYQHIERIQRNNSTAKTAFVAMSFKNTENLREAIRKGISDSGYNPVFIDEIEHNNLITPEILKYIRNSKFVVAELTHNNNGAYFEEGYALGIGKPVIQLCKKGVNLHFDIAQKNTIFWEREEEISQRLTARINATIE